MAGDHLRSMAAVEPTTPQGCQDCLAIGGQWVHLRLCMDCGHVGCCDSSPNQHATAHHRDTDHPVIQSFQPGEDWAWCHVDQDLVEAVPDDLRRPP